MRILTAALFAILFVLMHAPAAQALSGACAMRCLPAQQACMARNPGNAGLCRARHRACAYRCMGIR